MNRTVPGRCPLCGVDWSDSRHRCEKCGAEWVGAVIPDRCPTCGIALVELRFNCDNCGGHWSEDARLDRLAAAPVRLPLSAPVRVRRSTLWERLRWLLRGDEVP